jgi:hypothetical protein
LFYERYEQFLFARRGIIHANYGSAVGQGFVISDSRFASFITSRDLRWQAPISNYQPLTYDWRRHQSKNRFVYLIELAAGVG